MVTIKKVYQLTDYPYMCVCVCVGVGVCVCVMCVLCRPMCVYVCL